MPQTGEISGEKLNLQLSLMLVERFRVCLLQQTVQLSTFGCYSVSAVGRVRPHMLTLLST
jgi:hypothetical protein